MLDFKQYRLNQDSELDKFRNPDPERFIRFQFKVYTLLDSLEMGDKIDIVNKITPESYEVFIKVVCLYILMHRGDPIEKSYIEFSEDYTMIYRKKGFEMPQRKSHFYNRNRV